MSDNAPQQRKRRADLPTHTVVLVSSMLPPRLREQGSKFTMININDVYTALTGKPPITRKATMEWLIRYTTPAGHRPYLGVTKATGDQ